MKYWGLKELQPTRLLRQIYKVLTDALTNYQSFTLDHSYSKLLLPKYPKYLNSTTLKLLLNTITLNTTP